MRTRIHDGMRAVALLMAQLGGLVLCALIVMICVSIAGREIGSAFPATGLGPITGDFELVEMGMGFVIFAFLPLCQIDLAHASVDVFVSRFPAGLRRALAWLADMLFAAVLIVIAVQLWAGMTGKIASGQTTFLLQVPVWWAYAASLSGAWIAAFIALYLSGIRSAELISGRALLPDRAEAEM